MSKIIIIEKDLKTMKPSLIPATLADYPTLQNLWRFYVYDMGRYCATIKGWESPTDLSFVPDNLMRYFEDSDRYAFFVRVGDELAGFVLLNKIGTGPHVNWNIGEFFISANFQTKSIGTQVAFQLWDQFPGFWEVSIIPENTSAQQFWRKIISRYMNDQFSEEIKHIDWDHRQPTRVVFGFDTSQRNNSTVSTTTRKANSYDISAIVALSDQKRRAYEMAQPKFWRRATDANNQQSSWFTSLLNREDFIVLVAENNQKVVGFGVGQLLCAPEVYNPGGLTLQIDDFCIEKTESWERTGKELVEALKAHAKTKGAVQSLIVCGHHDNPKRSFLKSQNLEIASEWYVGGI